MDQIKMTELSKTINDKLADELILHILQFCDGITIKMAALVCVRWNNLIGSSSAIMKKFQLNLRGTRLKNDPDFRSQRFHYNVALDRHCKTLVPNLSMARFICYHSEASALMKMDFVKFLSESKMLESFEFSRDRFPIDEDLKFQMKLKTLKIRNGISNLLDFVDPEHLIKLNITTGCDDFNGENYKSMISLVKFLERAKNLKILSICLFELLEYFTTTKKAIPFKLTRLKLSCRGCRLKMNDLLKMKAESAALMQTQALSLTHLSLDFVPDFMFRILVNNLKKLENLRISRYMFNWSKESKLFYMGNVISTLKSLTCDDSLYSDIDVEALLGLCPNIENLTVCYLSFVNWDYMSVTNAKLKKLKLYCILKLDNCDGTSASKINLESLHVEHLYNCHYLQAFFNRCSAIKSLEIDWIHDSTFPLYVNKIVNSSLKELRLCGSFEYIKKTYDKLRSDFGNLEILIIKSNKWNSSTRHIFLRFDFPIDKSQWNVKKADRKFADFAIDFL